MRVQAQVIGSKRKCVFCATAGKMTGEHVYPLWTRETVLPDAREDSGYIFGSEEKRYVIPGMPVASIKVKRVCARCNNGWLADLEEKAKPLLTRPIQGNPKTFHFAEVGIVASWAYKTCILADLAGTKLLGPLGFRWLYERRRPPKGVVVTMAVNGGPRFPQYGVSVPAHYTIETGQGEKHDLDSYLLTIGIGHLVFQVFGHHMKQVVDLVPKDWKRDYCRIIWPPPGSVRWPPPKALNEEQLFQFSGTEFPSRESMRKAEWRH